MMFPVSASEDNFHDLVKILTSSHATLFIGAGMSASMLPTWAKLHGEMGEAAGMRPLRRFDASFAPADFADFRQSMGDEAYLRFLRKKFGGMITDYPELYRVLDDIAGFEQLVTTNYDGYLWAVALSNNVKPRIAVFPDLGEIGARYIYLHGRAETAQSPSDIVLTEDDYARAYEIPGHSKHLLEALFNRPGLFVGSSLQDPDLAILLRQRVRHANGRNVDTLPPLFAILPVKPSGSCEGDTRGNDATDEAEIIHARLKHFGVRPICYTSDPKHTQLRAILLQLRKEAKQRPIPSLFLDRSRQLDRLGALPDPGPNDILEVRELLRGVPELAKHFFEHSATNLSWYDILKESVILPGVTEPWSIGEQARQIAPWAAAPFVEAAARERPSQGVALVLELAGTENWHVRSVLGRIGARLPADHLKQVLPVLSSWLDDAPSYIGHLADRLTDQLPRLIEERHFDTALVIVGELLTERADTSELRLEPHRLGDVGKAIDNLLTERAIETYRTVQRSLSDVSRKASEVRGGYSSVWRSAIEDHEQNFDDWYPEASFLVVQTRDALVSCAKFDPAFAINEVTHLLASEDPIMKRLAIHTLSVVPSLLPLLPVPVLTMPVLINEDVFHEVAVLINSQFAKLDAESRSTLHTYLLTGIPSGIPIDVERAHWLAVLPEEHHTAEERVWWTEALTKKGRPEHPFFDFWHSGGKVEWGTSTEEPIAELDPLNAAWEKGGADALLAALRADEGWWTPLSKMVADDPQGLLSLAPKFDSTDTGRLVPYFEGYITALRNTPDVTFDWQPLVLLIEWLALELTAEMGSVGQEAAHLIALGASANANSIPDDLLERCITAMSQIIEVFATSLMVDPNDEGRIGLHHQINHAAGYASDAFMYCLWQLFILKRDDSRDFPSMAQERIRASLADGWGGIEFRHAIGEFSFVLGWWSSDWLATHIASVWPDGDSNSDINARRAFFIGFLHSQSVSVSALATLVGMFNDVALDFGTGGKTYFGETMAMDSYVHRLASAWGYEVPGFGFDGVLGTFLRSVPDETRASFVRRLGFAQLAKPGSSELDEQGAWKRRIAYWMQRTDDLGQKLDITQRSKELSAFCTWLEHSPESMAALEKRLAVSIDHLAEGGYRHDLIEFIAARGEAEPLPSIRVTLRLVERLFEDGDLRLWQANPDVEAALSAICRGAKSSHRTLIRKIADRFVRAGVTSYQSILADCGCSTTR